MRFLRKLFLWIIGLALLIVGGGVAVFYGTPSATIASLVSEQVKTATGRDLTIDGDINRTLFPVLGVRMGRVAVSNADWASDQAPIAEAEQVVFGVQFVPLLYGRFDIDEIRLENPKLRLEVAEDGRANWTFDAPAPAAPEAAAEAASDDGYAAPANTTPDADVDAETVGEDRVAALRDTLQRLSLKIAEVTGAELTYVDLSRGAAQRVEIREGDLAIALPSYDSTLTLQGSAVIQGRRGSLEGAFDSPAKIGSGEIANTEFSLAADGVSITYDGRVRAPTSLDETPEIDGQFALKLDGDPEKTEWLKTLAPALRPLGAADLTGQIKVAPETLDVAVNGRADFNGQQTTLDATAQAEGGWAEGAAPVAVDMALKNGLLDAGFEGDVTGDFAGGLDALPLVKGDYRVKAPDVRAVLNWSGGPAFDQSNPLSRLEAVDVSGAMDMTQTAANGQMTGEIRYGGRTVALRGAADGGSGWTAGDPLKVDLSVASADFFDMTFAGSVPTDPNSRTVDGALKFDTAKLRQVVEWASGQSVDAPSGVLRTLNIDATLSATDDRATATLATFKIDDAAATGELTATGLQGRPSIDAKLRAGALDLRAFEALGEGGGGERSRASRSGGGGGGGGGGGSRRASGGWSDEPIDYGPLQQLDATFDIAVDGVRTTQFRIGKSRIVGALKGGALDLDIRRLGLYGGVVKGAVKVDASSAPSIGVDLAATGVRLRPVLRDFANTTRLEGTGDMNLQVAGPARSMRELMTSVDGQGSLVFRDGAIIGINIAAMMRNLTTAFTGGGGDAQKTDFAELSASFTIRDGVLSNNDLTMLGPLVRLTGAGTVNLGAQSLNYRATPKAVASLKGQGGRADRAGIAVPVIISGPWSNPSFTPDLSGAIEGIASDPEALLGVVEGVAGGDVKELVPGDAGEVVDKIVPDGAGGDVAREVLRGLGGGGGGDDDKPDVGGAIRGLFGR